ncbi:uncharacterized protein LOC132743517 [Ruditapes philippinarum]|uniref:uncharacterized protein LOC132743517 n=1 Tax=Ruditapes philippinarum TaxID=129788 RepID=UPI00295AD7BD|nr:uncharacterized protein LOC132743517 [Ruditapes philippinarum]
MPCFVVNTKLGTAMIDSLGGPRRVNNMLATLNLKTVSETNLKKMEKRAGVVLEKVSTESANAAADEAYRLEMESVAEKESLEVQASMSGLVEELGVCPMPDTSPALMMSFHDNMNANEDNTDDESRPSEDDDLNCTGNDVSLSVETPLSCNAFSTPTDTRKPLPVQVLTPQSDSKTHQQIKKAKVRLLPKYPCQTRSGMSVAVDTAWHKRGFDSLTSHTFFMTTGKSRQPKKVVKTIVSHRTSGVCNWWRRKRPGQKVRPHACVRNHRGSARAMEATSGVKGVKELLAEGIPVEYLEGDGDNTLISRLKTDIGVSMKKRFDKNRVF